MEDITAAAIVGLATGVGAPLWATIVMLVIQTIKAVPQFARLIDGAEKLVAFILSAVLVVFAYIAAMQAIPPTVEIGFVSIIIAVLSWFNVARLSMALHDDLGQKANSLTGPETR